MVISVFAAKVELIKIKQLDKINISILFNAGSIDYWTINSDKIYYVNKI